jgi:hypothetical protein
MPMPHSIIHGNACFAYFNKSWDIPDAAFRRACAETERRRMWESALTPKILPTGALNSPLSRIKISLYNPP